MYLRAPYLTPVRDTTPIPDPLFFAFQQAVAGRYSIDHELGRGGMGVVYLAREVHLDRLVAIKLLPPERSAIPELRERFLREARLAAKLSHPNIIPIHAVAEQDEFVYYVMSFVDGMTLTERIRTRGPLSGSEGVRVLREVAWALAYAHGQGLVHRDVKPDNILLESGMGRVMIADFGIAAAAGSGDGVAGTPEFMSPEQVLGGTLDARSDLYGFGVTAFFALSGRLPIEGDSATEVMARQITEVPSTLSSIGVVVPRKLAQLVDRCLAKEPDRRPTSAEVVAEQLGVALEQRRELPPALRNFVKRSARLDGGGTLVYFAGLYVATGLASIFINGAWGLGNFLFGVTIVPFGYFVAAARRLLGQGFAHGDVGPAFKSEIERSQEERAAPQRRWVNWLEGMMPPLAKWSALAAVVSAVALAWSKAWEPAFGIVVLTTSTSLYSTIAYLVLRQRRSDVDAELWAKLWNGPIGRVAFAVARRLIGRRAIGPAMTHRATELSLGLAAEQLFESLPKASRQALGDLPGILRRLEKDAQALRAKSEAVQALLASSTDEAAEELRADREAIDARLRDAVGALETIRLNLLRLHAGALTVEGLTTHLGVAAEVSEEVERLIAAHDEMERGLSFPRPIASTPV